MFKKALLVSMLFIGFAAQAEQNNFYVGGQYSKTTLKEKESGYSGSVDFGSISALAGYQFNDYFALEARLGTGVKDKTSYDEEYKETLSIDLQAMLLAKASYALSKEFSVFAVAGYSKTEFAYKETGPSFGFSESESLNGLAYGIGAEYKFNDKLAVHLEYVVLPDKTFRDEEDSLKLEADNLSLGVSYYF